MATKQDAGDTCASSRCSMVETEIGYHDGRWIKNGKAMYTTKMYAVIEKGRGDGWRWFDFLEGRWSAVEVHTAFTLDKDFASMVAEKMDASVETYSLIRHP